ncbi:MAG: LptE family protein [Bacteroidales bacterium]|nr:LptE family protein [Bacteroidales bacterium]OQC59857.1 MAG: hypothetical protein BWX51_01324 [Bacteroidetes bacterium ADurb.Bin012]MBP9511880.1 LptE family protein [Bacteroidales bacterium]MBP9588327.1 LptE family protein [Bacteroidales bacterium]NMD16561.1 LptE family protein [Bacteroidales bacterium]
MPVKKTILLFLIALVSSSCRMSYSFTGASIPIEAKTISIDYFPNQASLVVPSLSQTLTEALRNRFITQTPLQLIRRNGDLNIEGSIISYITQPVAIQGTEQAALNRLTISVRVKFTNKFDEKQNFEQTFTRFEDYPFTANLNAVQDNLIQLIVEALVDDIFNKAVVNW